MAEEARIGILTISDRASRGEYEDEGGPAVQALLEEVLVSPWRPVAAIVPDEQPQIEAELIRMTEEERCCLIVTTGGTGPARRDITPEATEAVCDRILDGFGEQMRAVSLTKVATAILSRQIAGIRYHSSGTGGALIVNLPGRPKAIGENLMAVFAAIPYCIDLIEGPRLETDPAHVQAFRPKGK